MAPTQILEVPHIGAGICCGWFLPTLLIIIIIEHLYIYINIYKLIFKGASHNIDIYGVRDNYINLKQLLKCSQHNT